MTQQRAFPWAGDLNECPTFDLGMTLRDYFAIRAFQTRLAKYNDWTLSDLATQAYMDADALLLERSK